MNTQLLVGLGNPGEEYADTRHNAGFMAVGAIASKHKYGTFRNKFNGMITESIVARRKIVLLMPMTYMNDSGLSVEEVVYYHKLSPEQVTVFHDEIDFAPGKLQVRSTGGLAGHRGLLSVQRQIGNGFRRVRIGVGRPRIPGKVINHVLGDFTAEEKQMLYPMLDRMAVSLPLLLEDKNSQFIAEVIPSKLNVE